MKKYILFILLLIIPFFVYAEDSDIKIESISLDKVNGYAEQIKEPNIDDNQVNLGLKMNSLNDSITYKILINNNSEDDYVFDKDSLSSEYLNYDIILLMKMNQTY